jgi:hypothetical protein
MGKENTMRKVSSLTPLGIAPSVRDAELEQLVHEEEEARAQAAARARGVSQNTIDGARAMRLAGERRRGSISSADAAWLDNYLLELEGPRTDPPVAKIDNEAALRAWKSGRAKREPQE